MSVSHLYDFFGEMSTQGICPLFDWVVFLFIYLFVLLSCVSCLYILDINPLLVTSFTNIFSHSIGCLFILLMVSFDVQKLLSLFRCHLFIFISFALGERSKKLFLQYLSKSVLPMFSSKSFTFSGLKYRSLNHFEFIFVYGVRE